MVVLVYEFPYTDLSVNHHICIYTYTHTHMWLPQSWGMSTCHLHRFKPNKPTRCLLPNSAMGAAAFTSRFRLSCLRQRTMVRLCAWNAIRKACLRETLEATSLNNETCSGNQCRVYKTPACMSPNVHALTDCSTYGEHAIREPSNPRTTVLSGHVAV